MDRRGFLKMIGLGLPATAVAVQFGLLEMEESVNRVYSFPSQIRVLSYDDIAAATIKEIMPMLVDSYYKVSPAFVSLFQS